MNNKPIMEVDEFGTKKWYKNGKLHREDGPAIEHFNGTKFWYINGKRHRIDGPACEYPDGDKYWFIDGILINTIKNIFKEIIKYNE